MSGGGAAARAVLTDDNFAITLTIYAAETSLSTVLVPVRAVALAQELLTAAAPKLRREGLPDE